MSDAFELAESAQDDPADRALKVADAFLETERSEPARRAIVAALASSPQDPRLHAMLGRIALVEEHWKQAEECFGRALALAPNEAPYHCGIVLALVERGRYPQAEKAVLRALELDPELAWAWELYARVMHDTGHLDKARKLLRKSLALDPESESAHHLLSLVESERHERPAAAHHSREGLRVAPAEASSHAVEAARLLQSGHPFQARAAVREALGLDAGADHLVELYLQIDRCCRWIYLPMYYWSLLVERLPGGPVAVWFAFAGFVVARHLLKLEHAAFDVLVFAYIVLVVYTWVADPLTNFWIRLRPAR
jgi:tetratricopeptide (TPR) repeat protein